VGESEGGNATGRCIRIGFFVFVSKGGVGVFCGEWMGVVFCVGAAWLGRV
jgi:hypothetical protein